MKNYIPRKFTPGEYRQLPVIESSADRTAALIGENPPDAWVTESLVAQYRNADLNHGDKVYYVSRNSGIVSFEMGIIYREEKVKY